MFTNEKYIWFVMWNTFSSETHNELNGFRKYVDFDKWQHCRNFEIAPPKYEAQ